MYRKDKVLKLDLFSLCMTTPNVWDLLRHHVNQRFQTLRGQHGEYHDRHQVHLIQPNNNITPHSCSEMDFSFQIKLDTDHQRSCCQLAFGVRRAFQQLSLKTISTELSNDIKFLNWTDRSNEWRKGQQLDIPAGALNLSEVGKLGKLELKFVAIAFRPLSSLGE